MTLSVDVWHVASDGDVSDVGIQLRWVVQATKEPAREFKDGNPGVWAGGGTCDGRHVGG